MSSTEDHVQDFIWGPQDSQLPSCESCRGSHLQRHIRHQHVGSLEEWNEFPIHEAGIRVADQLTTWEEVDGNATMCTHSLTSPSLLSATQAGQNVELNNCK